MSKGIDLPVHGEHAQHPPPYSVTCASRNTSQHLNPMLNIYNHYGAVPISDSYIKNDWSNSTTLNAPRGLAESGLQGYYTCRTEGNTFLSPHMLHPSKQSVYRSNISIRAHTIKLGLTHF